ncbi:MAG: hypothetical protein HDR22_02000 [Lachnospiraceae bacterium]|nr:hypothetical protein [Lachnospiraceae bacterium]
MKKKTWKGLISLFVGILLLSSFLEVRAGNSNVNFSLQLSETNPDVVYCPKKVAIRPLLILDSTP